MIVGCDFLLWKASHKRFLRYNRSWNMNVRKLYVLDEIVGPRALHGLD